MYHRFFIGDKFGESLGGSQAPSNFWEVPGLPRKFPELPRKSFGDFPGSSLTVELNSNPEVPRKFPKLPQKLPKLPRKFPDFPGGQPLSLGSLTPSPDSQKLSLILILQINILIIYFDVTDVMTLHQKICQIINLQYFWAQNLEFVIEILTDHCCRRARFCPRTAVGRPHYGKPPAHCPKKFSENILMTCGLSPANIANYSRPDNYYIINSSGVQKCNVIFYYFLHGRRM